jgi:hypothetical protein
MRALVQSALAGRGACKSQWVRLLDWLEMKVAYERCVRAASLSTPVGMTVNKLRNSHCEIALGCRIPCPFLLTLVIQSFDDWMTIRQ